MDGLWGIVTQPFLHSSYSHLFSNTVPLIGVGWVLLLSGLRVWLFVTASSSWSAASRPGWWRRPAAIVGASALVFGWMGYLLARAYFSRRLKWILTAVALLIFFGTLLGNLLPSVDARVSWQSHLCGFLAGCFVGWLLHPRSGARNSDAPPVGWRRIVSAVHALNNDAPIGMLDSGVGGLTVARAVLDQLPHEALHYVGDTPQRPVRAAADRRGARARAAADGRARRVRCEGAGHRLQQRERRLPARRARALRHPGGRGRSSRRCAGPSRRRATGASA